jgi:O-antigen ligase
MTTVVRWLLLAALVGVLVDYGGAGDFVRPTLAATAAGLLLLLAVGLRSRFRVPPLGWIGLLFLPAAVLCLLQVMPLGWHHPWVTDDLAALGGISGNGAWSIAPAASLSTLVWTMTLAGLALVMGLTFRGERLRPFLDAVVLAVAAHAVAGLVLMLLGADWPTATNFNRARGSFVYANHAASFWAACLPLALLTARSSGRWWRWLACACLALAVLLSASRGGIIVASLVCLPLAIGMLPRRRRGWWAAAAAGAIALWLVAIGIEDITQRFTALRGPEGLTLSGRLTIWTEAWPVVKDAGPLGCGAGTVNTAYRRGENTAFAEFNINHLHCDPLEWWLEFGWGGVGAGLAGLIAAAWWLRPPPPSVADEHPERAQDRLCYRGAALGLLILALHSGFDFIWHNLAIDLLAVVFLTALAQCRADHQELPVRSTLSARLAVLVLGLALAALLAPEFRREREDVLAYRTGRLIAERLRDRQPIADTTLVQRTLAAQPTTVSLAVLQAWLLHYLPGDAADRPARLERARLALDAAAWAAPGDPRAWVERAALAADTGGRPDHIIADLERALVWARSWPEIQAVVLTCARQRGDAALPDDQLRPIVEQLLALDQPQPGWFFPFAARLLGEEVLSRRLAESEGERLQAAGLEWLAEHGSLEDWLRVRRHLARHAPASLPTHLELMRRPLHGDAPCALAMGSGNEERRQQADLLAAAGLPVPAELAAALRADGLPWSMWAEPLDLLKADQREQLELVLRGEWHRDWAKAWADRILLVQHAYSGDLSAVGGDTDPALIAALLAPDSKVPLSSGERQRLTMLLNRRQQLEWQPLPSQGQWSWLLIAYPPRPAVTVNRRWAGVVVDGCWLGWSRDGIDLAALAQPGLHRVAILEP